MPGVRFDLQLAGDSRDRGTLDVLQVPRLRTVHELRELRCRNRLVACPHDGRKQLFEVRATRGRESTRAARLGKEVKT